MFYKPDLTSQSLTDDELLMLLGVSQWVFNSNVHFIIEMVDTEHHSNSEESWFTFLELTAGQIKDYKNLIKKILGDDIYSLFSNLVEKRNQVIHSFPTGEKPDGYPISMYRKNIRSSYVNIDKAFLEQFIQDNNRLSRLIHQKRGS